MTPTCQYHMGTAHGQVFLISSIVWSHRFRPSPSWLVVTAVGRNCYSPVISLVVVRWLIYVTKLGGLSFRQWLGSCLVMRPANYTLINSVGDYYTTLGRRQFYCLFNSLSGLTTKKTSRQSVPAPLWWELMYYREFPLQRASNAQMLPWHDVIMKNRNI